MKEFSSQERWRLAGTVLSETKALVFIKVLPPGRRRSQQEKSTRPRLGFPFFSHDRQRWLNSGVVDAIFMCIEYRPLKDRPKFSGRYAASLGIRIYQSRKKRGM